MYKFIVISSIRKPLRIGRAGRAGQKGKAITFFTQDDVTNLRSIAAVMKQSGCQVPEYMLKLKQNPNKRKKLLKKAPHRDNISTILVKPEKRKIEAQDAKDINKTKDTDIVKNAKNNKHRKIQDGLTEKELKKKQKSNVKPNKEKNKIEKSKTKETKKSHKIFKNKRNKKKVTIV